MMNRRKTESAQSQHPVGRILIALGVFINIYMVLSFFFGEMGLFNAAKVKGTYVKVQAEIATIQRENETLLTHIEALKSDPETIERLAREQLGLVKDGELVFEFVETLPH